MNLLDVLTSLTADSAGGFSAEVSDDWKQGRTVYGGLNAALAARAARLASEELPPLRALQIAFLAPPLSPLRYVPTVLKQGRSVTFIGVDGFTGDDLCSRSTLTYGQARDTDVTHARLTAPVVPPPLECVVIPFDFTDAPAFFGQMEVRFAGGFPPLSGGEPHFAMWVRHRDAGGVDAESAALAIADVLPPAAFAARTYFKPGSTVTWTIDLAQPLPDAEGWYLMTTASDHAAGGYSLQAMSCFGADGRLAAVGRQTVAVF